MSTALAFVRFVGVVVRESFFQPPSPYRVLEEAHGIGVRSLPILLVVSAFVGTNLAVQGYNAFAPIGGERLIGMFVALAGVRELAPVMVASMIAAKAGTEMASQIAVMRIGEQIDALEVMALSPHAFLVTPRLIGILLVIPALTMISIFTLLVCSYGVAVYQLGLDPHDFVRMAAQTTRPVDLLSCALKSLVFGAIISLVSCFYGFTTTPGPAGVGRATNAAVVVSAVTCALLNYLLSEVLFG